MVDRCERSVKIIKELSKHLAISQVKAKTLAVLAFVSLILSWFCTLPFGLGKNNSVWFLVLQNVQDQVQDWVTALNYFLQIWSFCWNPVYQYKRCYHSFEEFIVIWVMSANRVEILQNLKRYFLSNCGQSSMLISLIS